MWGNNILKKNNNKETKIKALEQRENKDGQILDKEEKNSSIL